MATNESPEVLTLQSHFLDLQGAVIKEKVPGALFQYRLLTSDGFSHATNEAVRSNKRGQDTVMEIIDAVRMRPDLFQKVCDALKVEGDVTEGILNNIQGTFKQLKESHSESHETMEFQKLKDQLEVFQSTQQGTSDISIQQQTMNCSQHLIQQYIENGLGSGIEASNIKSDMEKLCCVYLVIPQHLSHWAMEEVDKISKTFTEELGRVANPVHFDKHQVPLLFSKDTLYHASLCCEAINSFVPVNPLSFFRNKKPQHSLTEVSFSQSRDGIMPYLIARQKDVLYVAFQGTCEISQWIKSTSSFDEGLREECSKIPLRFFMDELLNNKRIVLTGFSFGGMLALCISAKLWHSTMADQQALTERIICITFGQPLVKLKMVEDEISVSGEFEKSIHSVFSKDDFVPAMFSYMPIDNREPVPNVSPLLHPKMKALAAPNDAMSQGNPSEQALFSNPFVKTFLQNLSRIQENCQQLQVKPKVGDAVKWLDKAMLQLKEPTSPTLYGNCYVMSREKKKGIVWHSQTKELAAIALREHLLTKQLFEKHTMDHYIPLILRSHLEKPVKYIIPNQLKSTKEVSEVDALKPKITEQLMYYDYPNERVIILEGENLWFSYKVYLDEKGPNECEFKTHAENTTQYLIEFRAELEESSNLSLSKQVKLALYTHFASPIRQTLTIKMEPRVFSVRQMQLAKHTPSQIIQLAYLCALLEQRHQKSDSKRFTAIAKFLDKAVQVVPVESVFDAITYGKHEIALTCANALRERRLQLQPSQHMIIGALKASIRAHTGYDGVVIDRFIIPSVKTYQQATRAALWWLQSTQLPGHQMSFPAIGIAAQVVVESMHTGVKPKGTMKPKPPTRTTERRIKLSSQRSSKTYSDAAKSSPSQTTKLMAMPFSFPIFLNSHLNQSPHPFPEYITRYVDECLKGLIRHGHTTMSIQCGAEMRVVTKMNVGELYSAHGGKSAHFKSPLQILREGITKLGTYTEGHLLPAAKLPNEQMLALIEGIFQKDVSLCALLLGAFMEQQIRIPLIHSAKTTAETLSSQTAPVAVGVWALFSQNLASLEAKLKGHHRSQLIVDIREYMEGFSQKMLDDEDKMYAGKLQFLLHGIQRIVTASSQYISYSLEHQLCSNPKFDRSLTLKDLITEWDTIFQNDALSLIGESHRPLVARWLQWTILVHDLRETLAQYTCIGVTGFVNSGKSLLVRKLFKIQEVKVGIQAAKRTTVPLLYSLEDSVEGLDVIDFPGVDDTDHTIPELARLLLSLAQIIIFVVDFKRACSDPVKAWLQALSSNGAPIHICLTHADELYAECKAEGKLQNIEDELKRIRSHLKLDPHRTREVILYSFHHTSELSDEELKNCGINSEVDVGNWLVHVLRNKFKQEELAEKLKRFLKCQ